MTNQEHGTEKPAPTWRDYVALARPDHWVKHILIVPGMVLASMFRPESITEHLLDVMVGMLSAAAIASANYVLNEWLDRPFDAQNPRKAPCANNR